MTEVASLENSKRLYELSGLTGTYFDWSHSITNRSATKVYKEWKVVRSRLNQETIPAYSLRYILDKLPANYPVETEEGIFYPSLEMIKRADLYAFGYSYKNPKYKFKLNDFIAARKPTDAACLLLIKLYETGVIK